MENWQDMKAVLLSIKPKYCELITNGIKTIEARKTVPALMKPPFKCYIYCTRSGENIVYGGTDKEGTKYISIKNGKVIGEFVCDRLVWVVSHPTVFAGIETYHKKAIEDACLSEKEVEEYSNGKDVYGWHISDLVIYDEPKELSEFRSIDKKMQKECQFRFRYHVNPELCNCANLLAGFACSKTVQTEFCRPYEIEKCECFKSLTRPPQSWCYVGRKH